MQQTSLSSPKAYPAVLFRQMAHYHQFNLPTQLSNSSATLAGVLYQENKFIPSTGANVLKTASSPQGVRNTGQQNLIELIDECCLFIMQRFVRLS